MDLVVAERVDLLLRVVLPRVAVAEHEVLVHVAACAREVPGVRGFLLVPENGFPLVLVSGFLLVLVSGFLLVPGTGFLSVRGCGFPVVPVDF